MAENEKALEGRRRSPSYPVIAIDEAVDKARLIYTQDKRAFTPFEAVVDHLGYTVKKKGGRSARTVSALKQYGLLDERNGQYRVSDLAFQILETPNDAPERVRLIKKAALSPRIFRKLLNYYSGELPSDPALRSHLIFQEGFNPDSVKDFLKVFRGTIDIAKPLPEDYTGDDESEADEQPQTGARAMSQQPAQSLRSPTREEGARITSTYTASQLQGLGIQGAFNAPLASGEKDLKLNISADTQARIVFNGQVTQEAIELLAAMLEIQKRTFPKEADLPKDEPTAQNDEGGE
jgi:hypothetical protein